MFGEVEYDIIGEPTTPSAAHQLAQDDRYQFQWWALSLIRARPLGGEPGTRKGKKGSDKGIDGTINFIDDGSGKPKRVLVQVKSGHVKSGDIRDLPGTLAREKAAMGFCITLEEPTRDMLTEAASAGFCESPGWGQSYPKIQILTIEALLAGHQAPMPPAYGTFKMAAKLEEQEAAQAQLGLDL